MPTVVVRSKLPLNPKDEVDLRLVVSKILSEHTTVMTNKEIWDRVELDAIVPTDPDSLKEDIRVRVETTLLPDYDNGDLEDVSGEMLRAMGPTWKAVSYRIAVRKIEEGGRNSTSID